MKTDSLATLRTPTGSVSVHSLTFGSNDPGAVVISGIHGDEFNGPLALALLGRRLALLERLGRIKRGIVLIPVCNPLALDLNRRNFPFEEIDLHANFDLHPHLPQNLAERLVLPLQDITRPVDLLVDVHSSNSLVIEAPQIRYYVRDTLTDQKARQIASESGFNTVWEKEHGSSLDRESPTPIGQSLVTTHPGIAFFIQAGMAGTINHSSALRVARGIVRVLAAADCLDVRSSTARKPLIASPNGPMHVHSIQLGDEKHTRYARNVSASRGGLFLPSQGVLVGGVLPRGEGFRLGTLIDPVSGSVISTIEKGLIDASYLLSLRVGGLVYPGSLIARLVSPQV